MQLIRINSVHFSFRPSFDSVSNAPIAQDARDRITEEVLSQVFHQFARIDLNSTDGKAAQLLREYIFLFWIQIANHNSFVERLLWRSLTEAIFFALPIAATFASGSSFAAREEAVRTS